MTPTSHPTEEQLIEALRSALIDNEGGVDAYTVLELATNMNLGVLSVRKALKRLIDRGEVEPIYVYRTTIAGHRKRVPGYRIVGTML